MFGPSRLAFSKLLSSALKSGFLKTLHSRLRLDLKIVCCAPFPQDSQDGPIKSTWIHSLALAQSSTPERALNRGEVLVIWGGWKLEVNDENAEPLKPAKRRRVAPAPAISAPAPSPHRVRDVTRDAASRDIFETEGVCVGGRQASYRMRQQEAYINKEDTESDMAEKAAYVPE
ncbi:hypothetical protein K438DRAFT_1768186 [Mycena galopus ATCC 62051]|nr:hypothetical protein K438DRAFT_1768186 [Mycena galopus ATCC 62051]